MYNRTFARRIACGAYIAAMWVWQGRHFFVTMEYVWHTCVLYKSPYFLIAKRAELL